MAHALAHSIDYKPNRSILPGGIADTRASEHSSGPASLVGFLGASSGGLKVTIRAV